jgi:signal recognition particle subunit SRP54
MAFEGLASKLQETLKKLRGKGKLSEKDIKDAMREVKLALLEADVNYKVVKNFVKSTSEKCLGEEVLKSLTPGQQVIKIVNEELTDLMGNSQSSIEYDSNGLTIIMLVGLQGAGKTTMCGKLALQLRKKNKNPILVACDIYRPAAIKQLQVVGKEINIPVFSMGDKKAAVDICKGAVEYARGNDFNVLIIDTAGRLQIDEKLMDELSQIKEGVNPNEILLVVDAMTGQDAVNVDTRGGAALSIRSMTGKPIKFVGVGEKMSDFEIFYPDRMASRILGMGDVLSLIEKAQQSIDKEEAEKLGSRMLTKEFNFEDFLSMMQQAKKLGPLSKLIEMVPGANTKALQGIDFSKGEKELVKIEAIINSMTLEERRNPPVVSASSSRKKRIAKGSGTTIQMVNKLLKDFARMKKMMKQFSGSGMKKGFKKGPFGNLPF